MAILMWDSCVNILDLELFMNYFKESERMKKRRGLAAILSAMMCIWAVVPVYAEEVPVEGAETAIEIASGAVQNEDDLTLSTDTQSDYNADLDEELSRPITPLEYYDLDFDLLTDEAVYYSNNDYRTWAQNDPRWGSMILGSGPKNCASIGCLVTSVTKLIIQSGFRDSNSFNVGTMITWLNSNNGFSGQDLYWGKPSEFAPGFTNLGTLLRYGSYSSSQYNDTIIDWIRDGKHIIICVNSGGHYIAVDEPRSLQTGQVYIMDSLSNTSSNADIRLVDRYGTFNEIHGYSGGSSGQIIDPTWAKLYIENDQSSFWIGDEVKFRMESDGTPNCTIEVWKGDDKYLVEGWGDYVTNYSHVFTEPGKYRANVSNYSMDGTIEVVSNEVEFTVCPHLTAPNVKAEVNGTKVRLSWDAVEWATHYDVRIYYADGTHYEDHWGGMPPLLYEDLVLPPNTRFYAQVCSSNIDAGNYCYCEPVYFTTGSDVIEPTSVSLNKTSLELLVGGTETLTATVSPSDATNKTVTWASDNTSVATISNGKITAKAVGTAKITAKTSNGKTATCNVTVKPVLPTNITLNKTAITLTVGGTETLTATISPSNATDKTVTWTTDNASVATVSNGKITVKAVGTAKITAKTSNGKTATCTVTVGPVFPTSITLNKTTMTLGVGDTETLTATVSPSDATDKTVTWASDKTSVATVSNGKITAKAEGTAKITAKTSNGKTATCTVTVVAVPVTGIKLDKTDVILAEGNTQTLKAEITPSNATDRSVTWTSADTNVATVSSTGVVTAVSTGRTVITAETSNGKKATCTVSVTGIMLDKSSLTLTVGQTATLTATIISFNPSNTGVTWISGNDNVATVSSTGVVTAKAKGKTIITAQTAGGKAAVCTVTVNTVEVTSVTLNKTSTTLTIGGTETLTATISPSNATDKTVTWTSDNTSVATVSNGKITAKAVGTAKITAKTSNGKTAVCTVVVDPVLPTGITLNKTSVKLTVGGTETLTATISPSNATDKTVTWTSDKTSVATVSNGKITAKAVGTAKITAKTVNGKSAVCTVTVDPVLPTGITLNKTSTTLSIGGTETLTASVSPTNATDKTVTWTSDDESIAIVSSNGKIVGVAEGSATITAKTSNGKTATCTVTVDAAVVAPTGITLNKTATTLTVGGTETLTATVSPSDATDKTVTWTSDNTSVATVSDGLITAKAVGTAKITAKTSNGKPAICTVTVDPVLPTGITLSKTSVSLNVGDTLTLKATVKPTNATDKSVTWTSDKTSVATVSNGKITAKAVGTAKITAKTTNGKTATCTVTVTKKTLEPDSVALDKTELTLEVGKTNILTATISPSNVEDASITWSTSDDSVAMVSTNGRVVGIAEGTAIITAKTSNGKTATCTVTVTQKVLEPDSVVLDKTELTLEVGKTDILTATITPSDVEDASITWSTSDDAVAMVSTNGRVVGIAEGTAIITAKTSNGKTATCTVIVVSGETLVPAKPTVVIKTAFGGRTVQLNCSDTDADIYYQFGSSNITKSCKHVKAGETIFLDEPMTGNRAAMYFKAYKNGKWSVLGKWGVLNVQIAKPLITPSGKASENNFKVYTQTKDSYIIYTLDGSFPAINEGTQKLTVKNGKIVWGTTAVIKVPKGKTIKAIAVRCGLVTSDVMTYTNR